MMIRGVYPLKPVDANPLQIYIPPFSLSLPLVFFPFHSFSPIALSPFRILLLQIQLAGLGSAVSSPGSLGLRKRILTHNTCLKMHLVAASFTVSYPTFPMTQNVLMMSADNKVMWRDVIVVVVVNVEVTTWFIRTFYWHCCLNVSQWMLLSTMRKTLWLVINVYEQKDVLQSLATVEIANKTLNASATSSFLTISQPGPGYSFSLFLSVQSFTSLLFLSLTFSSFLFQFCSVYKAILCLSSAHSFWFILVFPTYMYDV